MNATASPPPRLADQPTTGTPPTERQPRSASEKVITTLLAIGVFCAFLVFVIGVLVLIWEPIGLPIVGRLADDKGIDRMLTVVGRQLNFVSLFVACFSLFMAVAGIFINRHFKGFDDRQQRFQSRQDKLDEDSRKLQEKQAELENALSNVGEIRNTIRADFNTFKTQSEDADKQLRGEITAENRKLSQETTIFNAEFVLSALLPDPCSTQQIPVEMTYVLHQFQRLIDEYVKDDLDERLKGNGALIRFAQALHRYGVNADDPRCAELLKQARSTAGPEMDFKILYRLGICHRQLRQWQESILIFRKLRSSCEEGGYFARYRVLANLGEAITWLGWRAHLLDRTVWDENVLSHIKCAYAEDDLHGFLPILHGQAVDTFARDDKNHLLFCDRFLQNSYDCALAAWKLHVSEKGATRPPPLLLAYYLTKILYFMAPADISRLTAGVNPEKSWLDPARKGVEDYLRLENISTTERVDPFMALNYRLCLIYVHLCHCRHFVQVNEKAVKDAEVQDMIKSLQKDCGGDRLSAEAKAVKLRMKIFEPTIYSEHFEREVDVSAFAAEVAKLP